MTEKKSRKELLKHEDAFLTVASRFAAWIKHHSKGVGALFALAALAIVGVWIAIEHTEGSRLAASKLYATALEIKAAEVVTDASTAQPTTTPPTFGSKEERAKAARQAFEAVVKAQPRSGVAELSRFYIAVLSAELGDRDQALRGFRELVGRGSADDSLHFLSVERAAYLLEQMGDHDAAIKMWERLTVGSKLFYADQALFQLARLYAAKNDNERARAMLARIEKDYPQSPVMAQVRELYGRIGRPETAALSAPAPDAAKKPAP